MKRFESPRLGRLLDQLILREGFDRLVCDHLTPATYFPRLDEAFLFQHNVETVIWRRHVEHAKDPIRRAYFAVQAGKMERFERRVCRTVRHTIAVSSIDAQNMRDYFGVTNISEIPTGVNIEHHAPPSPAEVKPFADLAFVGSMDWLANIDGVTWFVDEVLPLIRRRRPDCSFAVIGRSPPSAIQAMAAQDPRIFVTGTVPDVRPYLWGSAVSIVPLRIGGGTRLKIYESMASRVPVVSTRVGAEGLELRAPQTGRLADTPEEFAAACLELLDAPDERARVADNAWQMVNDRFSWGNVARCFEEILEQH
jgi:glycosyltransferase involved in cell wall biosynthesis